ncbi:WD40 repeat-like protein [Cucurbitaria berberidis CBS 394.84]|uniref:WD40 repeat-like protein n=1 Tax=Cucurbitaria berberidis CBS 394.84 TaxID=1168544 RepID=A0A9P4LA91_9PLEO|nr:WD40 repeat-like protein [Cucurbitaria berberidis CBS 394.84]KAF1846964.1 WD40 repeat-like protein [Cucurbitaria berberidis CBS 394.84]
MVDTIPKIKVTDPQARATSPFERQNGITTTIEGPLTNLKLAAKLRNSTSPPAQANETHNGSSSDGRRPSEAAIDPLSQQILQRTNTATGVPKLRPQNTEAVYTQSPTLPNEANADKKQSGETTRETGGASKADKKKGVSFLSRFIGSNKKKGALDGASDNGSEADDLRREGMDAQLYVDNFSFSPKVPQPPAYIKVRTKFKKEKEFDRVFLAQQLRCGSDKKSPPAAGSNPAPQSGSAATHNPTWAVEFSKDGKYLAAGGQDRVVRVWAVIASPEERRSHERHESDPHASGDGAKHLSAPVFQQKTYREYHGHTSTILDLSWSKNNFLLSSSMDKTVRLWHVSRDENLCTFKHSDFVPSIQFHPTDDRFFLAGSLDAKLRLWSIPDKSVAFSITVPDMITAVCFTPDGKTCIAGTLGGLCMFYDTEGLKWQSQLHVKSTRGQNAKGSKITGIQATYWPPGSANGEVKLLVSSNDSRLRVYNMKDKSLEMKFRGHENNCSQIRAALADSSGHIICGSEDRKAYIWSTTATEGEKRNERPVEMFEAHNSITTCTVIAPVQTKRLLSASEDPIFDLCNPPPVTLVSRAESGISSRAPTEAGSALPTPADTDATFKRAAESPAYIARSAHCGGNIIVTADYTGSLKVFRQDCAFAKRLRMSETWETSSMKRSGSRIGRPSSILSRTSRTRRDSVSTQPPNDRIMTWRQGISHGSFDSTNSSVANRSASPRKPLVSLGLQSPRPLDAPAQAPTQPVAAANSGLTGTPKTSMSIERTTSTQSVSHSENSSSPHKQPLTQAEPELYDSFDRRPSASNPLAVYNGQSWAFWSTRDKSGLTASNADDDRPNLNPRLSNASQISKLTSEMSDPGHSGDESRKDDIQCIKCGSEEFKVRFQEGEKVLVCGVCARVVE